MAVTVAIYLTITLTDLKMTHVIHQAEADCKNLDNISQSLLVFKRLYIHLDNISRCSIIDCPWSGLIQVQAILART